MIDPHRFGPWVSAEAAGGFAAEVIGAAPPPGDLSVLRDHYDGFNRRHLDVARAHYPTEIETIRMAGVEVHVVQPVGGPTSPGRLICLHGGGFSWGAGAGALLEAVPVAAVTGMTVVAVDYRLAPEHLFPAAVEDALAVYRAMIDAQPDDAIGVFGCSAGAILTGQLVARLIAQDLPLPAAIAMFHGAPIDFLGDSMMTAGPLSGAPPQAQAPSFRDFPYFALADLTDPLVLPGNHPAMLERFPPSLLVSGSRDFAASAVSVMHRRLLAAGVPAELILFDGMWHAHHMATTLPESRETFAVLGRFLRRYLG